MYQLELWVLEKRAEENKQQQKLQKKYEKNESSREKLLRDVAGDSSKGSKARLVGSAVGKAAYKGLPRAGIGYGVGSALALTGAAGPAAPVAGAAALGGYGVAKGVSKAVRQHKERQNLKAQSAQAKLMKHDARKELLTKKLEAIKTKNG